MQEGYATQYRTPCVIVEDGDTADEVVDFARDISAVTYEGQEEVLVIELRPGIQECYSERALRSSMQEKSVDAIGVFEGSENEDGLDLI
jgi:hypothetical protein